MTVPVWMASPPEVHSALLSSGPGPGGLFDAAASWSSLSATYADTADELTATLAAVQAGAWEGPSAEQYVTAHAPYLSWLMRASANSAAAAARHETAATAYTAALAAMPTLPELAANHAVHGVLVATNFFGINTIPIALNEADYARMWIQAAITMATYQSVSAVAVASAPQTDPAPVILHSDSGNSGGDEDDGSGIVDNDSGDPYQLSWWVNRVTEITKTLGRDLAEFRTNPADAISDLLHDIPALVADEFSHAIEVFQAFPQLTALPFIVPTGVAGGIAGFGALAGIQPDTVITPAVAAAPMPPTPEPNYPAVGSAPVVSTVAAPAPTSVPASAPATAPAAAPGTAAPPPPGIEAAGYPYLVGGPGIGSGTGMSTSAQRRASEPDSAAAAVAAAASARENQRTRRRRRAAMKDRYRGYEFMDPDLDTEAAPDPFADPVTSVTSAVASPQGARTLGFAGTARKGADIRAAGLTALAGDDFGGGPSVPMVPRTWELDEREPDEGDCC